MQPNLGKLDSDYQILTELHRADDSVTYLARSTALNRDVAITVLQATGDASHLKAFASDVEVLKAERHPSVVPVIEGRWLDDATFAVVRARVRGSSLDQLISAVGELPREKIDAALRDVASALAWARDNGVVQRRLVPESLLFQQGNGRVLVAFEPSRVVADDATTIRELAAAMNAGRSMDVAPYLALLTPAAAGAAAAIPPRPVERQVPVAVGRDDSVVVVQRQGMGFMPRVLTAFAVIAVIVVAGVWYMQRRNDDARRTAMAVTDTTNAASGEVASGGVGFDTAAKPSQGYPTPTIVVPPPPPTPAPQQYTPVYQQPLTTVPVQPQPQLPPQTQPQPVVPPTTTSAPVPPADVKPQPTIDTSVTRPATGDVCDSQAEADQRQCVSSAIDRADQKVRDVYEKLIVALRRSAAVADSEPDPPAVGDLRSAQRRWVDDRDTVCRVAAAGAMLSARERASCYTDRTAQRVHELQAQLDAVP